MLKLKSVQSKNVLTILLLPLFVFVLSCSAGFDAKSNAGNANKSYNYFFKVIISDEKKRNMSDDQVAALSSSISRLNTLFASNTSRMCRSEDDTINNVSYVSASIFANKAIQDETMNIIKGGATVLFSSTEFLLDKCNSTAAVSDKANNETMYSVFTADKYGNNPESDDSWSVQTYSSIGRYCRSDLSDSEIINTVDAENTTSLQINDTEAVNNYYSAYVETAVSMDGVENMDNEDGTMTISSNNGSTMDVEYDQSDDSQKRWSPKSKIKKVATKMRSDWNDMSTGQQVVFVAFVVAGTVLFVTGVGGFPFVIFL